MASQVKRLLVVLVAAGAVALTGCGGSKSDTTTAAPPVPEEQRTTPAAVATGLRNIEGIAGQIAAAAGTDKVKATELAEQIEPQWQPVEGTVKANDQDAYLAFEDSFAVLEGAAEKGDGAAAAKGSDAVSSTAQRYLAKYPG